MDLGGLNFKLSRLLVWMLISDRITYKTQHAILNAVPSEKELEVSQIEATFSLLLKSTGKHKLSPHLVHVG